jgi:NADH-quinone oxidoreductase subunit D
MLRAFLDSVPIALNEINNLLTRNPIFIDRTRNVGIISKEDAIAYGLTGPMLRGSGVDHDVRKANPYLDYEKYDFEIPIGTVGDCYDRYLVRIEEMRQSLRILRQAIDNLPDGPINVVDGKSRLPEKEDVLLSMEQLIHHFIITTEGIDAPVGEVYFGAENPKGELGFYINSLGGGVPHRLKIRGPSFVNLGIVSKILPGHMIGDVVTILGSIDMVFGECDR